MRYTKTYVYEHNLIRTTFTMTDTLLLKESSPVQEKGLLKIVQKPINEQHPAKPKCETPGKKNDVSFVQIRKQIPVAELKKEASPAKVNNATLSLVSSPSVVINSAKATNANAVTSVSQSLTGIQVIK